MEWPSVSSGSGIGEAADLHLDAGSWGMNGRNILPLPALSPFTSIPTVLPGDCPRAWSIGVIAGVPEVLLPLRYPYGHRPPALTIYIEFHPLTNYLTNTRYPSWTHLPWTSCPPADTERWFARSSSGSTQSTGRSASPPSTHRYHATSLHTALGHQPPENHHEYRQCCRPLVRALRIGRGCCALVHPSRKGHWRLRRAHCNRYLQEGLWKWPEKQAGYIRRRMFNT